MAEFPDDIFTEPEDVDPHGLANLGPLRRLAGTWEGLRGVDVNPKADGPETREYLERIESENDAKRVALGVADELKQIDGLTGQMLVALGEDGIKTIEDFAGCAADDLVGWSERKDGETKKFEGLFSKFEVSRTEAENMVVQARLLAGWITEADLATEEAPEAEDAEEAPAAERE